MRTCAIIIYNYESLEYLRACIRQIRRYKHPDIEHHVYVSDQSSVATNESVKKEFYDQPDVTIVHLDPRFSGYAIDYILRNVSVHHEFLCCMDVDAFPIHRNWLTLCISLLQDNERQLKFVGGLAFESYPPSVIYPPVPFFSMSPFFCVGRTIDWRELSLEAGFTRFHERPKTDLIFKNNDWGEWAKDDYINRGSDDHVVAWCWEDKYMEHNKLSLAITNIIGVPGEESGYGRILDDIVFHFGFCHTHKGVELQMGNRYMEWVRRINEDFSDDLIAEMISVACSGAHNTVDPFSSRQLWDGTIKRSGRAPDEINKRIAELKLG